MVRIANTSCFVGTIFIALVSCATPSRIQKKASFEAVNMGDDRTKIESSWGPGHSESEEYPSITFTLLQYARLDGRPDVFFTIDLKSGKVIGKAQWLYNGDTEYDLATLEKTRFPDVKWDAYVPCHTWSDNDLILVNRDRGIYIATERGHASLVSWSTPELVALRVESLFQRCPKLQHGSLKSE